MEVPLCRAPCEPACERELSPYGGMCYAHRERERKGIPLTTPVGDRSFQDASSRYFNSTTGRYEDHPEAGCVNLRERLCYICDRVAYRPGLCRPHFDWAKDNGLVGARAAEIAKAIDKAQRLKTKGNGLRHSYRMEVQDFESLLYVIQGGICPLCLTAAPSIDEMLSGRFWVVDHDHSCCEKPPTCGQCTRGVLCGGCNTSLRMGLQVDGWMERATKYVGDMRLSDTVHRLRNSE